jgi:TolB-like protein/DNA-binding winged helix-turn-helix (wHTH) protein
MHEFGQYRYDEEQRLLFRDGVLFPLEPKALETLHALIVRRGQVVEKAELMKLVWPDTVVEDVGLARNVSLLRKALGDEAGGCIETVPKRGYRFVGAEVAAVPAARAGLGWWRWVAVAALLGGLVYWQFYRPSRFLGGGAQTASLAVAPLENLSPEWESVALARGLSETLVAELAKLERVHVVSPGTVRRYQWVGISTAMMGRLLGLDVLVEGAVQRAGGKVNVSARLVDVHSGKLIWAENFERPAGEAAAAQTEMARTIAAQIDERLKRAGE